MKKLDTRIDTRKKTYKQKEKNKRQKKRSQFKRSQFKRSQLKNTNVDKTNADKPESYMNRVRRLIRSVHKDKLEGLRRIKDLSLKKLSNWFNPKVDARQRQSQKIRKPSMRASRGFMSNNMAARMPLGSSRFLKNKMYNPTVQSIDFAQPARVLSVVPEASLPRGRSRKILREAEARPINISYAETYEEDPGLTSEIVGDLRPHLTRRMTRSEINKEQSWARRNAERSQGQRASSIVWPQSELRQSVQNLSEKEKDELRSFGEEIDPNMGGYNRYNAISRARSTLKRQRYIHSNTDLTSSEIQKLTNMGIEYVLPKNKEERLEALKEYREFLVSSNSPEY